MQDQTYSDWTGFFNQRYGVGTLRRNVAIGVPIVQNFTMPKDLRQDGSVPLAPSAIRRTGGACSDPCTDLGIPHIDGTTAYDLVFSNVNFRGQGKYEIEDHVNGAPHFDLPEFEPSSRTKGEPQRARKIPLDIRRKAFI